MDSGGGRRPGQSQGRRTSARMDAGGGRRGSMSSPSPPTRHPSASPDHWMPSLTSPLGSTGSSFSSSVSRQSSTPAERGLSRRGVVYVGAGQAPKQSPRGEPPSPAMATAPSGTPSKRSDEARSGSARRGFGATSALVSSPSFTANGSETAQTAPTSLAWPRRQGGDDDPHRDADTPLPFFGVAGGGGGGGGAPPTLRRPKVHLMLDNQDSDDISSTAPAVSPTDRTTPPTASGGRGGGASSSSGRRPSSGFNMGHSASILAGSFSETLRPRPVAPLHRHSVAKTLSASTTLCEPSTFSTVTVQSSGSLLLKESRFASPVNPNAATKKGPFSSPSDDPFGAVVDRDKQTSVPPVTTLAWPRQNSTITTAAAAESASHPFAKRGSGPPRAVAHQRQWDSALDRQRQSYNNTNHNNKRVATVPPAQPVVDALRKRASSSGGSRCEGVAPSPTGGQGRRRSTQVRSTDTGAAWEQQQFLLSSNNTCTARHRSFEDGLVLDMYEFLEAVGKEVEAAALQQAMEEGLHHCFTSLDVSTTENENSEESDDDDDDDDSESSGGGGTAPTPLRKAGRGGKTAKQMERPFPFHADYHNLQFTDEWFACPRQDTDEWDSARDSATADNEEEKDDGEEDGPFGSGPAAAAVYFHEAVTAEPPLFIAGMVVDPVSERFLLGGMAFFEEARVLRVPPTTTTAAEASSARGSILNNLYGAGGAGTAPPPTGKLLVREYISVSKKNEGHMIQAFSALTPDIATTVVPSKNRIIPAELARTLLAQTLPGCVVRAFPLANVVQRRCRPQAPAAEESAVVHSGDRLPSIVAGSSLKRTVLATPTVFLALPRTSRTTSFVGVGDEGEKPRPMAPQQQQQQRHHDHPLWSSFSPLSTANVSAARVHRASTTSTLAGSTPFDESFVIDIGGEGGTSNVGAHGRQIRKSVRGVSVGGGTREEARDLSNISLVSTSVGVPGDRVAPSAGARASSFKVRQPRREPIGHEIALSDTNPELYEWALSKDPATLQEPIDNIRAFLDYFSSGFAVKHMVYRLLTAVRRVQRFMRGCLARKRRAMECMLRRWRNLEVESRLRLQHYHPPPSSLERVELIATTVLQQYMLTTRESKTQLIQELWQERRSAYRAYREQRKLDDFVSRCQRENRPATAEGWHAEQHRQRLAADDAGIEDFAESASERTRLRMLSTTVAGLGGCSGGGGRASGLGWQQQAGGGGAARRGTREGGDTHRPPATVAVLAAGRETVRDTSDILGASDSSGGSGFATPPQCFLPPRASDVAGVVRGLLRPSGGESSRAGSAAGTASLTMDEVGQARGSTTHTGVPSAVGSVFKGPHRTAVLDAVAALRQSREEDEVHARYGWFIPPEKLLEVSHQRLLASLQSSVLTIEQVQHEVKRAAAEAAEAQAPAAHAEPSHTARGLVKKSRSAGARGNSPYNAAANDSSSSTNAMGRVAGRYGGHAGADGGTTTMPPLGRNAPRKSKNNRNPLATPLAALHTYSLPTGTSAESIPSSSPSAFSSPSLSFSPPPPFSPFPAAAAHTGATPTLPNIMRPFGGKTRA